MHKFKIITIFFIVLLSHFLRAGKDEISHIKVGSKEMYELFESKGIEYTSGLSFVEALTRGGLPGAHLLFKKDTLSNTIEEFKIHTPHIHRNILPK